MNEDNPVRYIKTKASKLRLSYLACREFEKRIVDFETRHSFKSYLFQCLHNAARDGIRIGGNNPIDPVIVDIFRGVAATLKVPFIQISQRNKFLIASIDGVVAGDARIVISADCSDEIYFNHLHIERACLNKGVASALYDHADLRAKLAGHRLVGGPHLSNEGFDFLRTHRPDLVEDDLRNHRDLIGQIVNLDQGDARVLSLFQDYAIALLPENPHRLIVHRDFFINNGFIRKHQPRPVQIAMPMMA